MCFLYEPDFLTDLELECCPFTKLKAVVGKDLDLEKGFLRANVDGPVDGKAEYYELDGKTDDEDDDDDARWEAIMAIFAKDAHQRLHK